MLTKTGVLKGFDNDRIGGKNEKAINIDDVVFDVVNHILLTIVLLIIIYPLYFVVIA